LRNFKPFVVLICDFESEIEVSQSEEMEVQCLDDRASLLDVIVIIACIVERESDGSCVFKGGYYLIL
jgi:hypothetical protein